jgi:hypothetical protein
MVVWKEFPMVALTDPPVSRLRLTGGDDADTFVEARRLDHTLRARRMPHVRATDSRLHLNGLSITLDEPLAPGEHLALLVCGSRRRRWQAHGRVTSCQPVGDGYRIAIAYDLLPAA